MGTRVRGARQPQRGSYRAKLWGAVTLLALLAPTVNLAVDRQEPALPELAGIDIVEHPNALLPLDLPFVDDAGRPVTLRQYFQAGRPVVLSLNYYSCPMLCTLVLNGAVEAFKQVPLDPATDFEIVTVSINPQETAELAAAKKATYVKAYGRSEAAAGWHFLTGTEPNIRALADALGFQYRYLAARDEYAHAAALFVATPDGHVSRYLYGVQFDPRTLRLALTEAADGKIGSTIDRILLWCYHYDPATGQYSWAATALLRLGAVVTIFTLGFVLFWFWRQEGRRRRNEALVGH